MVSMKQENDYGMNNSSKWLSMIITVINFKAPTKID